MRYEITGTATDTWDCATIQKALNDVKAMAVSKRRAFGMSNQPYVATFCAADQAEADRFADAARAAIPGIESRRSLPALLAFPYS